MSGGAKDPSVCLWAARVPKAPFTKRVAPGRQIFLPDKYLPTYMSGLNPTVAVFMPRPYLDIFLVRWH